MRCGNNVEDNSCHLEALSDGKNTINNEIEDVGFDMIEFTKSGDFVLAEVECQDTTENSSSFSCTISGTENASTFSDVEVESPFCEGNGLASMVDGYSEAVPMRKKLTDHWWRLIHPIMWRCKWIELQIKEMKFQALKYDTELARYDQRKQDKFQNSIAEGFDAISQPFSSQIQGNQVMKRKKRKRVEEKTDLAPYMSQHNLFSYYESKRCNASGAFTENDYGNVDDKIFNVTDGLEFNDGWPSLEFRDGENSLVQMLSKIEVVQSQVCKLKDRIVKVVSENPGKYRSVNRLSLLEPSNGLTGSDQNIASPPESGGGMPDMSLYVSPLHISKGNKKDCLIPESAVSSHGEVTPLPDIMESIGQPRIWDSCETNKDAILLDNETCDEELQNFQRVISQFTARHRESSEELNKSLPAATPESILPTKTSRLHGLPSTSKSNLRNTWRKWGRRKSQSGKWKRRSLG